MTLSVPQSLKQLMVAINKFNRDDAKKRTSQRDTVARSIAKQPLFSRRTPTR